MLHILHLYSLPDKTIAGITTMYSNSETFVLGPDGVTDSFFTTTGIVQGDTLAHYLFIIVVDYILRINQQPWTHSPRKKIHRSPQQAYYSFRLCRRYIQPDK